MTLCGSIGARARNAQYLIHFAGIYKNKPGSIEQLRRRVGQHSTAAQVTAIARRRLPGLAGPSGR